MGSRTEATERLRSSGLMTDLYELTMMQGYQHFEKNVPVVFDLFFRSQPWDGGYSVFAGLEDALSFLEDLTFSEDEIEWLGGLGYFEDWFLRELAEFSFSGDVYAMPEGSLVFPGEPIIRVHAGLAEAQLIESALLNIANFQTLVATKTARIIAASHHGRVLEMGLRRAQGPDGALSASRAAYIGGAAATSNTYAGKVFGLPIRGTMAHSWVMSFDTEREAFEKYAELYPDGCIFLIDTYDTLRTGLENAISVGYKLREQGKSFGVRLDSGDLQYLSVRCRRRLDQAGFPDAKIAVSNELDERIVAQLISDGAPIDLWGVGTHMVTGGSRSSFPGVYKLAAREVRGTMKPVMKVSDTPGKSSNPGIKQVHRFYSEENGPFADLICLEDAPPDFDAPIEFHHPTSDSQRFTVHSFTEVEPLLKPVMKAGRKLQKETTLDDIRSRTLSQLARLDGTYKRLINPHIYKVSLSRDLKRMKTAIREKRP
ncbi:MAG: nicotinate phosphoribosyltransferase [Spirochaetota bacterium]